MARRRYYRYPRRTVAAKKKWATNLKTGSINSANGSDLVVNSAQTSTPTPVIIKTGNFKIQGDVAITNNEGVSGTISLYIFLAFVPQGYSITNLTEEHPEYIMGWTCVDTPFISSGTLAANKFSISTRLKRNLNSGDKIVLFYKNNSTTLASIQPSVAYTAQYYTCAN